MQLQNEIWSQPMGVLFQNYHDSLAAVMSTHFWDRGQTLFFHLRMFFRTIRFVPILAEDNKLMRRSVSFVQAGKGIFVVVLVENHKVVFYDFPGLHTITSALGQIMIFLP